MLEYLLKSAACMAVFLVFYQFLLEQEPMHQFKRFFLLGALIASLTIPALVFTEYVEAVPQQASNIPSIVTSENLPTVAEPATDMDIINWSLLLWTIYGIGALVFALRFIKHLFQILQRIRKNPKLRLHAITQVFIREQMPPHTFFNYVFLNKEAMENKDIPKEVLLHEETHAKQLHSFDVLLIELLQVILWFNPLLILFKKNIKLNHEFLADNAVLKENVPTKNYQNTLLSFLSAASVNNYQSIKMANTIIYSSNRAERSRGIKKRFTVMKKRTSNKSVFWRTLLLVPITALMVSAFCENRTVYHHQNTTSIDGIWLEKPMEYYAFSITSDGETQKLYSGYTEIPVVNINEQYYAQYPTYLSELVFDGEKSVLKFQGKEYIRFENSNRKKYEGQWESTDASIQLHIENYNSAFICNLTLQGKTNKFYPHGAGSKGFGFSYGHGVWSFELKNGKLHDSRGNIYVKKENRIKSESKNHSFSKGITEKELLEYEELAQKYEDSKIGKSRVLFSEIQRMLDLLNAMSEKQKRNTKIIFTPMAISQQTSASLEEMKEYNTLATKYNAIPIEERKIPLKDLTKLEKIYRNMTQKQKENAQPFPECLPKNLQKGASREQMKEYNALAKKYNAMTRENMKVKIKEVERMKYIYGFMSEKQKADAEPFPEFPIPPEMPTFRSPPEVRDVSPQPPPPPPTPPSPLDHVIEMAKKGATFYYEGKEISSDRAIELLRSDKNLNIQTSKKDSKNPQVRISKSPIRN